jgi:hypothetical protein
MHVVCDQVRIQEWTQEKSNCSQEIGLRAQNFMLIILG